MIIPTWNNLNYLKLCIRSIEENSHFNIQIIVMVNEGVDGTLEWLQTKKEIDFLHSKTNIGICYAVNSARKLVKSDYIVYVNDDMYLLPDWDLELYREIEAIGHKKFMLSATMIEPIETGNSCVVVRDYGRDIASFKEKELLAEYATLKRNDWMGSTWPPNVVHRDMWDLIGGFSIEFSPGMYSDPDFSKKMFETGVRLFKGKGSSLVYHFGSKSTKRVKQNKGRKTFLRKWGITANIFVKKYLKLGEVYSGEAVEPQIGFLEKWINRLKGF